MNVTNASTAGLMLSLAEQAQKAEASTPQSAELHARVGTELSPDPASQQVQLALLDAVYRALEPVKETHKSVAVGQSSLYVFYEEMRVFRKKLKRLQEPEPEPLGTKLRPSYKPTRDHLEQLEKPPQLGQASDVSRLLDQTAGADPKTTT